MTSFPYKILVVDDDFDVQFLIQKALRNVLDSGSSVSLASSGDEAISYMIGEGKYADRANYPFPTVIMTDLNMNPGDGFDVLKFLQSNPAWNGVPRIVLSSSKDDGDVRTAYLLGGSIYFTKPTEPLAWDALMRNIVEYLATGRVAPVDETGRILVTQRTGRRSGEPIPSRMCYNDRHPLRS